MTELLHAAHKATNHFIIVLNLSPTKQKISCPISLKKIDSYIITDELVGTIEGAKTIQSQIKWEHLFYSPYTLPLIKSFNYEGALILLFCYYNKRTLTWMPGYPVLIVIYMYHQMKTCFLYLMCHSFPICPSHFLFLILKRLSIPHHEENYCLNLAVRQA